MARRRKRSIRAEDLYRFELPIGCELAPDGSVVAFSLHRLDRVTQQHHANLWLAPVRGGGPQRLTRGDQLDVAPRWSPDGRLLAFLSNRGRERQTQIYLIPVTGGEAWPLTDLDGDIGEISWSPDGCTIAFELRRKDPELVRREAEPQRRTPEPLTRRFTRVFYKADGIGYLPQERWHLWCVDIQTGRRRQLTSGELHDERAPTWSEDGAEIAFVSNRSADPDADIEAVDLFTIPADGGPLRCIETPRGEISLPRFSPDGAWIAFVGTEGRSDWWKNQSLYVIPARSRGPLVNLTAPHDLHVCHWTVSDLSIATMVPPTWSSDSRRIFFQAARRGDTQLCSVDIRTGALDTMIGGPGVVGAFSFDRARENLAYLFGDTTCPGQIRVRSLTGGRDRALTRFNRWLGRVELSEVEEQVLETRSGHSLQVWILRPPSFSPTKVYASVLCIHGGPWSQSGRAFVHELQYLAGQGFVVYYTNPRGSQGYGEAFARAIDNGWGTVDYEDLMAVTEHVGELPYIDRARMGVFGGSYGGFMTNWIIGHTDRFAAAVSERGVFNLVSLWGSSDLNWLFQYCFGGRPPWDGLEDYWRQSPARTIGAARTPTLVLHGAADRRCGIEQSEQLYVALKRLGVETELVLFPEEDHAFWLSGRPDRRVERLRLIARWLDRHLY